MTLDPYRSAIESVLDDDLREELHKAEARCEQELREALAAKGRATDHIRSCHVGRPFEHLEADLENEHEELIVYHKRKLAKKIRWILEAYKDTPEE